MCFFVCLALPEKHTPRLRALSAGFELIDATDWNIGKVTCGNPDRDVAFLVTEGGCSCFISAEKDHGQQAGKMKEFERLVESLLKELSIVSILIHYCANDVREEFVIRRDKKVVSFDEVMGQLGRLELDVRHVIKET